MRMAGSPPGPGEPPFIAEAGAFLRRHGSHPAFRLLGWFLGCGQEDLALLVKHLYCAGLPSNTVTFEESPARTVAGLALLPFYYLFAKSWWWRPSEEADCNFETIDPTFFERGFSRTYALLEGRKRLTPRSECRFPGVERTSPCLASVRLADLLRLALLLPVWVPALAVLTWSTGINFLRVSRQAVAVYLCYAGYFRRYPCGLFVTYDDMPNHPCRVLAYRRHCRGEFVSIQNGERGLLPQGAFGMADRYFVFGPAHVEMARLLGTRARVVEPVGALWLNASHELCLREAAKGPPAAACDLLFIDQGVWPHNGVPKCFDDALDLLLDNLTLFAERHPELRVCYQLRPYPPGCEEPRDAVLERLRTRWRGRFVVLENDGAGESYRNILRAGLVVTFESSMGFEAMMMGKKALFVNYSGNPGETLCPDPRFQLEDPEADYGRLEAKVLGLLASPFEGPPKVAVDRCGFFDGRSQERIAAALASGAVAPRRRD